MRVCEDVRWENLFSSISARPVPGASSPLHLNWKMILRNGQIALSLLYLLSVIDKLWSRRYYPWYVVDNAQAHRTHTHTRYTLFNSTSSTVFRVQFVSSTWHLNVVSYSIAELVSHAILGTRHRAHTEHWMDDSANNERWTRTWAWAHLLNRIVQVFEFINLN